MRTMPTLLIAAALACTGTVRDPLRAATPYGASTALPGLFTTSASLSNHASDNGPPTEASDAPRLIGVARIPGDTPDRSGLMEPMSGGIPSNLVGSFGSGLAYAGRDDLYYAISDRGPADGAHLFRDRFHLLRFVADPSKPDSLSCEVVETALLTDATGRPYVGYAGALDTASPQAGIRLDPEGIAVSPGGTLWTCDEYGPSLDEWTTRGIHLRRLDAPARYQVEHAAASPQEELPPHNSKGRQANRGFEGVALSPDGQRIYALMQGPLLQDGALDGSNKRIGVNNRLVEAVLNPSGADATWREFVYVLDDAGNGLNELTALSDGQFLVIEKDAQPGAKAKVRRIYRIDLREASDISSVDSLPVTGLPEGVRPVAKTLVLDLLDPRFGLAGPDMPEKVEGLALGPALPGGRRTLMVASDNDYNPASPSWVWAFSLQLDVPASHQ